ncbi:YhcN/YlaJ family sporulation lipoprotein [Bacillus sp. JJ1122]|uniref:YhcN/YlaJ family sporulation lipoprotein n=1 Tax=Bacillus sp. JJ1122 TaxID=3122951 RepID=UPI002FFE83FC
MKFIKRLSLALFTIALITGCNMNNGAREDVRDNDNDNAKVQNYNNRGARILNDNLNDNNDNLNDNNNTQMRVHDEVKNKIEDLNEVKRAHVIITDSTAYVGVVLNDTQTNNISKDIEDKISDVVKSTDKSIDNVYVSSNPDFVGNMRDYSNQIQNGQPIRGLYDDFKNMVQRVFPTAR